MGGHKPRSVQSSINRPEHGDYVTLSWAQSVTDNVSQEAVGVGAGVGSSFAPTPPKEALNDLLQRAHNTMEDNDALPPAGVFEVEGANVTDDAAFPEIGFDQQNALCTTTIDAYDGKKLGITRKEIGPGGEAYSTVMGPTYVKIEFQDEASLDYPYVIPVPGKKDYVRAAPYGNARLLWHGDIDPSVFTEDCNSIIQNGYVNIGDDCWWQFFKLEQPLQTCGYAQAFIVDHCGNQIGTCKIRRTIWLSDINCASQPLPVGTVVLCLWFTWLNKWVAINWTEECPDFEEFTPPPSTIVKTTIPARFEVSAPEDPCNPDIAENGSNPGENGGVGSNANTRGGEAQTRGISGSDANNGGGGNGAGNGGDDSSCTIYLVYTETKYYKDNCGLFCLYDTEEKRIPLTLPTYTSYIPVYCTINETQGGSDSSSASDESDSESSSDGSDSDSCACDSGRWIHIVYPEVQINCGKICFTGNTIEAPGCDISLTQDDPITQYDNIFTYSESSDICDDDTDNSDACHSCSTLTITQRTRTAKIACDEWCISEWTEGDSVTIPVVACEGGEFTYIDNISFFPSNECGCIEYVITYAPVSLHCGAVCPDSLVQSEPIKICMNGITDSIEVVTDVKLKKENGSTKISILKKVLNFNHGVLCSTSDKEESDSFSESSSSSCSDCSDSYCDEGIMQVQVHVVRQADPSIGVDALDTYVTGYVDSYSFRVGDSIYNSVYWDCTCTLSAIISKTCYTTSSDYYNAWNSINANEKWWAN